MDDTNATAFADSNLTQSQKNMLAGGIAGCIAKTATAPLSRLTVLYQVDSLLSKSNFKSNNNFCKNDNIFIALRNIIRNQGVLSLWNGNLTSVIHRFPYSAINFSAYEASHTFLCKMNNGNDSIRNRFLSGAFAGGTACFICYPLDLVRTRLTVTNASNNTDNYIKNLKVGGRIISYMNKIIQQEGILGLYSGLPISLLVTVPTLGISFSVYGYVKSKLIALGGVFTKKKVFNNNDIGMSITDTNQLSPFGSLFSGCVSGIFSSCTMFPIDVIRKRMQIIGEVQPKYNSKLLISNKQELLLPTNNIIHNTIGNNSSISSSNYSKEVINKTKQFGKYNSTIGQVKYIMKTEGVIGFYRGIIPELLKVCPQVAIMFCAYEIVKNSLNSN